MLAGASSIFIQNIRHPYILFLSLWHNQFPICVNDHHFIDRLFHGEDVKTNAVKFPSKTCFCYHLLVSHVQFNFIAIDEFGAIYSFLNQWWCVKPTLLKLYHLFQYTEANIKYNHLSSTKESLGKAEKKIWSSALFMKFPLNQLCRATISLRNIYVIHYFRWSIRNRVILFIIRMWIVRTKIQPSHIHFRVQMDMYS